jgi:hypothetical protein
VRGPSLRRYPSELVERRWWDARDPSARLVRTLGLGSPVAAAGASPPGRSAPNVHPPSSLGVVTEMRSGASWVGMDNHPYALGSFVGRHGQLPMRARKLRGPARAIAHVRSEASWAGMGNHPCVLGSFVGRRGQAPLCARELRGPAWAITLVRLRASELRWACRVSARGRPTPSELGGWTFGAERPGGEAPAAAMGAPSPKVLTSRALGSRASHHRLSTSSLG